MKKIESVIIRSNKDQAIRCMNEYKVNIQIALIKSLQQRNRYLMKMCKLNTTNSKNLDIRIFFI